MDVVMKRQIDRSSNSNVEHEWTGKQKKFVYVDNGCIIMIKLALSNSRMKIYVVRMCIAGNVCAAASCPRMLWCR